MESVLLFTCILMWVFAIGASVVLWWLVLDINKLAKKQDEQDEMIRRLQNGENDVL